MPLSKILNKRILPIMVVVFILSLAVTSIDLDKPYEVWDEITSYTVGLQFWYNIAHGDFNEDSWSISPHPPVARYMFGVVNGGYLVSTVGSELFSASQDDAIEILHFNKTMLPGRLLSIFIASLTALVIFLIGHELYDEKTGFIASLFFILSPAVLGFVKLATPDSITIFFYTIAIYFFILGVKHDKYRHYIISAVLTGLAIGSKLNSGTLFFVLPLIYIAYKRKNVVQLKTIKIILIYLILPVAIFFGIWPRLWSNTVTNLSEIVGAQSFVSTVPEYFLGGLEHPVYYYFTYLFVKTPFLLLVLLIPAVYLLIKNKENTYITLFLWLLIPIITLSFFGTIKQTGIKNILIIYPALVLLAARGTLFLTETFKRKHIEKIVVVIILIYLAINAAFVHPYYLDYFNELSGGPRNVYENNLFLFGFWGEGIGQAAFYVYDVAEQDTTVQFYVMPRHVIPTLREDMTDLTPHVPSYLSETGEHENWIMTDVIPEADYLVESAHFRLHMNTTFNKLIQDQYDIIHIIEVESAPLAWIYKKN